MNSTGHKHKREKSLLKQLSHWVNPHGSVNISHQMLVENQKTERSNICTHPSPQQDGPEFNYQHEVFWTCPASPVPSHSAKTSTLNWRETPMSDCCVCVCVCSGISWKPVHGGFLPHACLVGPSSVDPVLYCTLYIISLSHMFTIRLFGWLNGKENKRKTSKLCESQDDWRC